jgi:hypothetical protein
MILKVLNRRHNKSYEGVSMNIKQKKIFRAFVLVLLLLLAGTMLWFWQTPIKPRSIPIGDYTYTIEYSKYRISQVMKQKHLPSFAVVLIDDQNIIWQETFGLSNIEKNQPAEPDTVYRLWSISKAFTAIETMRLIEDGLVNLDTPITIYIPFLIPCRSLFATSSCSAPACHAMVAIELI